MLHTGEYIFMYIWKLNAIPATRLDAILDKEKMIWKHLRKVDKFAGIDSRLDKNRLSM